MVLGADQVTLGVSAGRAEDSRNVIARQCRSGLSHVAILLSAVDLAIVRLFHAVSWSLLATVMAGRASTSSSRWQRIQCPSLGSICGGGSVSQMTPILRGQRAWKRHPVVRSGHTREGIAQGNALRLGRCRVDRGNGRKQRFRVGMIGP